MKYYQQSLSSLARNTSELEKENIRSSCLKFIQNNESYSGQFNYLVDDEKNWCQIGGKGVIPCKKTESHEDLDAVPESDLLSILEFYSSLKDEIINEKS